MSRLNKIAALIFKNPYYLSAFIFTAFACTAWIRPLLLPDEARYVGAASNMLTFHNWLTPTLNGVPFFHKPPLFYWFSALGLSLFGHIEWAARLPSILFATVATLGCYWFVRRWVNERIARITVAALIIQPLFFLAAQFANMDMSVAACITLTILLAAHAALSNLETKQSQFALIAAYGVAALGILSKGLIGAVLPGGVIIVWLLFNGRFTIIFKMISIPGIVLFLLISSPWFLTMHLQYAGFSDYFFMEQHFKRFASADFNNVQPAWFYVAVLLGACAPCLVWIVRKRNIKTNPTVFSLLWIWVAVITVFFSIPHSKLLGYIIPVVPALAILFALGISQTVKMRTAARIYVAGIAIFYCVVSGATVGILGQNRSRNDMDMGLALKSVYSPGQAVLVIGKFPYSLGFYARLQNPVSIVEDWKNPNLQAFDGWQKELADGIAFDPQVLDSKLIDTDQMKTAMCANLVSWVIGRPEDLARHPVIAPLASVQFQKNDLNTIWKIDRTQASVNAALNCPQKPIPN